MDLREFTNVQLTSAQAALWRVQTPEGEAFRSAFSEGVYAALRSRTNATLRIVDPSGRMLVELA